MWKCVEIIADTTGNAEWCGQLNGTGSFEYSSVSYIPKGSFNYRLGVRDNWGPFKGVELEWHLELPTNPASMEFKMALGLPGISKLPLYHKLSAGWGIGIWADNSFFGEYALSLPFKSHELFFAARETWLATQVSEVLNEDFEDPLPRKQEWVFQLGSGLALSLPEILILPDVIIPHLNMTFPQIANGNRKIRKEDVGPLLWDFNLGVAWKF